VDVNQIVTNRILEALESGVAPWRKPWQTIGGGVAKNLVSGKAYTGINQFLLQLGTASTSPYWLTYKQAAELGGHVRKGERGSPVVFVGEAKNRNGDTEADGTTYKFLRYYTVFNLSQTDNIPADKIPAIVTRERTQHERLAAAEAIVAAFADRPTITTADQAWYRPSSDVVGIPALDLFDSPAAYYSTLFHELGHSTGHVSRCNRPGITDAARFGSATYSKEELVAEMTAAFLSNAAGLDTIAPSASYLKAWITVLKGDSRLVVSAAAQAQKAYEYIVNAKQ